MRKLLFCGVLIVGMAGFIGVYGQPPEPGSIPQSQGDKDLSNNNIKVRSIELERIKKEAVRREAESYAPINTEIKKKFPEIKEDFEGIQIAEAAVIKAYTTGKTIDYATIAESARTIGTKAKRLDSNLFAEAEKEDKAKEPQVLKNEPTKLRGMIVALDTAIGSFVTSKVFNNIQVIEPEVAIKTRKDLYDIMRLSRMVEDEALRLKQK